VTPECGIYVISILKIRKENHGTIAAIFQEYLESLSTNYYKFLVLAPSREDLEDIVCFCGFEDAEKAEHSSKVRKGHPP
jgi:hypothetical protein